MFLKQCSDASVKFEIICKKTLTNFYEQSLFFYTFYNEGSHKKDFLICWKAEECIVSVSIIKIIVKLTKTFNDCLKGSNFFDILNLIIPNVSLILKSIVNFSNLSPWFL